GCCFGQPRFGHGQRPFLQRRPTRRGGLNSPACRT
ncbi:putative glucose-sensitive porin, partial [Pseudomonas aeruginosa]